MYIGHRRISVIKSDEIQIGLTEQEKEFADKLIVLLKKI